MGDFQPMTASSGNVQPVATLGGRPSTEQLSGDEFPDRRHDGDTGGGVVVDWSWTVAYVKAHGDRAIMFASLGVAIGAVLLLVFLIVRLVVARRRNVIKSLSTSSQSSSSSVEKQQQQQQQQPQQHFVAASLPPKSSETVALLSPVNSSPPCISTGGSGSSETSLSRQRRRPDKVHFAQLPSDAELTATRPSQGTSVTDDTVMTPGSAATSLNDVFLPSSVSTPSATQSQGVISRQWQMSADVIDDVDDVTVGVLLRNDTSRGSFYNNPYRHDTIDGRIRTSRVK